MYKKICLQLGINLRGSMQFVKADEELEDDAVNALRSTLQTSNN